MKAAWLKAIANQRFRHPKLFEEAHGGFDFSPELASNSEPGSNTAIRERILIVLATLKASCRNQASNLLLDVGSKPGPFSAVMHVADAEVLLLPRCLHKLHGASKLLADDHHV